MDFDDLIFDVPSKCNFAEVSSKNKLKIKLKMFGIIVFFSSLLFFPLFLFWYFLFVVPSSEYKLLSCIRS